MSQLLVVLNDKELTKILQGKLSLKYGFEVIVKTSSIDAISILQILPDIELILCCDVIGNDHLAQKIGDWLIANKEAVNNEIELVILGEKMTNYSKAIAIGANSSYQKIIDYIGFLLGKEERNILVEEAAMEQERIEKEKANRERLQKENEEKKKVIEERIQRGNARLEKLEQEKLAKEKLAKENAEKERLEKEHLVKEKEKEKEQALNEKEQLAKEKERSEKERRREQEALERIEKGKERIAKVAREKAEKESLENKKRKEIEVQEKIEKSKEKIAMLVPGKDGPGKNHVEQEELQSEESDNEKTTVFKLPAKQKHQDDYVSDKKVTTVEYHSISIIYFMNLAETTLDFSAYARIKKSDGFEYIKKFQPDMKLSAKDLERVLVRCGKELYINSEEASKANAFLNNLFLERFKNPNLSFPERMKLNSDSFEILLEVFKNSSFDKYNIEIIKVLVKSIDILMKTESGINDFRLSIKNNKLAYGYTHLHLTCFIFLQIYDKFPWSKEHTKNKIIYLSLFHDLCLKSDRLIKIHHRYFSESSNLNEDEKNLIFSHADSAATILENIIKAPKELTNFVREHHGITSGKSFTESLSITTSPVCMAFIAIEDFVTRYLACLEKNDNSDQKQLGAISLVEVFDELKIKYNKLTYAEVVQQIQSYFTHL